MSENTPFNQFVSVAFVVSPPNFLHTPSLGGAEWEYLDAMEGLLSNNKNTDVLSTFLVTFSKHHMVQTSTTQTAMYKIHSSQLNLCPLVHTMYVMLKSYTIQYNLTNKDHSLSYHVIHLYTDMIPTVYGSSL